MNDVYQLEVTKFVREQLSLEHPIIVFETVAQHHNYPVRNQTDLRPPQCNREDKRRSIVYNGCIIWNSLPVNVRNIESIPSLKRATKRYCIDQY